jgi:sugar lactone lactonase YvrE
VALDKQGNVYVVDMYNSQIKKFSADGTPLLVFGDAGDTAGKFSRIKDVAVDDSGYIYVSDGLQVAVQVFDPSGNFVGFVGRKDVNDPQSDSLFQAPHGVKLDGGRLFVVDRFAGIFIFDLGPVPAPTTLAPGVETSTTE